MALRNRVCLLTGASGLFGTEFIRRHAQHYTIVAVHNRGTIGFATQDQAFFDPLDLSRPIVRNAYRVHSISADLSKVASIEALVDEVLTEFGCVDLLINAAAER